MYGFESTIDSGTEEFGRNREAMLVHVESFRSAEQKVFDSAEAAREKFAKRGKLLPWDRVRRLLDRDSNFLELCSLAGHRMHDDKDGSMAGGGVIGGIGMVCGIRCLVVASNSAIKGGTISPAGLQKTLRLQAIAKENKLPIITLAESGGANLNYATDVFVEGARSFANQARLSAMGIPQITIVHGNATAGGAYQPGLSDFVVVVKSQSKLFLAGPPLLKAATGEIATDEELGGAEMHAEQAGTAEFMTADDADAIETVRSLAAMLPWERCLSLKRSPSEPAAYDQSDLLGIVPADSKQPYDVREIVIRLADGGRYKDFKADYDRQTVCGFMKIDGFSCGIIGNNGPITAAGATKAAQFIQLCEQNDIAIIFFHNTTGFMVGTESEQNGIIKHGSKMLQAVANASVPRLTVVVGGSYGAGNYAMCGRGLDPRFIFAWPNSRTAVMGGPQAGKVLRIVAEEKQRKLGMEPDPKMLDAIEQATADKLDKGSTALFGTARLWDDGLIDPRDTREILALCLLVSSEASSRSLKPSTFGVARL